MKVAITGGSGCVGRRLIADLIAENHQVFVYLRELDSIDRFHGMQKLAYDDNSNFEVDAFIHAAAVTPATGREYSANVILTQKALDRAFHLKSRHFLYLSSMGVAGDLFTGQRSVFSPDGPDCGYAAGKLECESLVKSFCKKKGISYTILRPSLIYGPYDRGMIQMLLNQIKTGFVLLLGDGTNRKMLCSVENISKVVLISLDNPKAFQKTFLVADREIYPVKEIIVKLSGMAGKQPKLFFVPKLFCYALAWVFSLLEKVGIRFPIQSHDIRKALVDAWWDPTETEAILGVRLEGGFGTSMKEEVAWFVDRASIHSPA